jgi:hypothetical protein
MTAPARPPLDRRRLGPILDRLSSNFDGEALVAARRAGAIVRGAGVTWNELLNSPMIKPGPPPSSAPPLDVDAIINAALMRPGRLTAWEIAFVNSLAERRTRRLSERQFVAVERIGAKLNLRRRL